MSNFHLPSRDPIYYRVNSLPAVPGTVHEYVRVCTGTYLVLYHTGAGTVMFDSCDQNITIPGTGTMLLLRLLLRE